MPAKGNKKKQKDVLKDIDASFGESVRKRQWCLHKDGVLHIPHTKKHFSEFHIPVKRIITYASTAGAATLLANQDVVVGRVHYRSCANNPDCFQDQAMVVDTKRYKNGYVCGKRLLSSLFSIFFLIVLFVRAISKIPGCR